MPTLNWEDIEADAKKTDPDGDFVTFDEIHLKMWVPSILTAQELTEEDAEEGCYGYYADADEVSGFAVYYYDDQTIAEYAEEIEGYDNCTAPVPTMVNGYSTFTYKNTEFDTSSVVLNAGKDCAEIVFWPANDEDFSRLTTYMIASIVNN